MRFYSLKILQPPHIVNDHSLIQSFIISEASGTDNVGFQRSETQQTLVKADGNEQAMIDANGNVQ